MLQNWIVSHTMTQVVLNSICYSEQLWINTQQGGYILVRFVYIINVELRDEIIHGHIPVLVIYIKIHQWYKIKLGIIVSFKTSFCWSSTFEDFCTFFDFLFPFHSVKIPRIPGLRQQKVCNIVIYYHDIYQQVSRYY